MQHWGWRNAKGNQLHSSDEESLHPDDSSKNNSDLLNYYTFNKSLYSNTEPYPPDGLH